MQVFRSFGAQLLSGARGTSGGPRADVFERLLERHTPKLFYCQPSAHNPTGLAVTPETGAAPAGGGGAPSGADRRGRVRRQPLLRRRADAAAQGGRPRRRRHLHRHVLEDPVPGAAPGLARRAAGPSSSGSRRPSSSPTCTRAPSSRRPSIGSASASCSTATRRASRPSTRGVARCCWRRCGGACRPRSPGRSRRAASRCCVTLPAGMDAGAPACPRRSSAASPSRPGAPFFVDGGGRQTLRLSFSSVAAGRIDEGVRRLAETIKSARSRRRDRDRVERAAVPVV